MMNKKPRRSLSDLERQEELLSSSETAPPKPRQVTKKKTLLTYMPPAVYEQIRKLGFEERTKMNTLILEGIDLLFAQRGLKSLAELETQHD